jgi:NADPH2:quinone reductase
VITAAVCTDLANDGALELQDRPSPSLGPGAVRIAVRAASVNFPDALMVRGLYQATLTPPFVAGSECAGVVTEVAEGVEGLAVGDRVLALVGTGGFATEVVATPPGQQVHRIPDAMSWAEAAAFDMTYGTAINGLVSRGGLRSGEWALVLGASGGCGSAAVQVAKAQGARVIAVAGGPGKCELARRLGADVVLDHRELDSLAGPVEEHTDGRGVDVLFDTVGGADVRDHLRCLAWNGRYLVIGFASGEIPTVKLNQTILKCISLVGVAYGMSAIMDPAANAADFRQLFDWYEQGLVHPAIGHRFPLDRVEEAMEVVYDRRALGKVVIDMPV